MNVNVSSSSRCGMMSALCLCFVYGSSGGGDRYVVIW